MPDWLCLVIMLLGLAAGAAFLVLGKKHHG